MGEWLRHFVDVVFTQEDLDEALDLYVADFYTCTFRGLNFGFHSIAGMIFSGCDFRGADLSNCGIDKNTIFVNCEFDENTKMPDVPMTCPEEGAFIGYKKAIFGDMMEPDECIVTLQIPEDAKRSSAFGKKCRCDKAKVIEIIALDVKEGLLEEGISYYTLSFNKHKLLKEAVSSHDASFKYRLGETVEVKDFNEFRWNECAPGIHFYMDPYEAEDHIF